MLNFEFIDVDFDVANLIFRHGNLEHDSSILSRLLYGCLIDWKLSVDCWLHLFEQSMFSFLQLVWLFSLTEVIPLDIAGQPPIVLGILRYIHDPQWYSHFAVLFSRNELVALTDVNGVGFGRCAVDQSHQMVISGSSHLQSSRFIAIGGILNGKHKHTVKVRLPPEHRHLSESTKSICLAIDCVDSALVSILSRPDLKNRDVILNSAVVHVECGWLRIGVTMQIVWVITPEGQDGRQQTQNYECFHNIW